MDAAIIFPRMSLCSGVDGLAHDPIAQAWALTPAAYAAAAAQAASWGAPLLLLGGGGYSSPAAACTWAGVLAALLGRQLPDDIPEHEQFERYGPAFTLSSGMQVVRDREQGFAGREEEGKEELSLGVATGQHRLGSTNAFLPLPLLPSLECLG